MMPESTDEKRESTTEAGHQPLERIVGHLADAFVSLDQQWRFTYVNDKFEDVTQRSRTELLGRCIWDVFPELQQTSFEAEVRRAMHEHALVAFEEFWEQCRRWYEFRVYPTDQGISIFGADVTERHEAQQALADAREQLHLALSAARMMVWRWDLATDHIASIEGGKLFFRETSTMVSRLVNGVHPEDQEAFKQWQAAARTGEQPGDLTVRMLRPDGSQRWLMLRGRVQHDEKGQPSVVIGVGADLTEQKRTEAALRESEAKFRSLFSSNIVPLAYWSDSGLITDANDAYLKLVGCTVEDLRAERIRWDEYAPADQLPQIHEVVRQMKAGRKPPPIEHDIIRPDGTRVPVYIGGCLLPEFTDRGVAFAVDLTEQKHAEELLCQSEERFRLAAQCATDIIYEWMLDSGEVRWFGDLSRMAECGVRQLPETVDAWNALVYSEDRPHYLAMMDEHIRTGEPFELEYRVTAFDGTIRHWSDRGRLVVNEQGRSVKMVGACSDVTDQERAQAELTKLNETLEHRVAERTAEAEQRATQLREMAAELAQTEQRERRKLAQVLHDHLQQLLVAAKLRVGVLADNLPEESRDAAKQINELLDQSIDESRSLTVELSPPALIEEGLFAAMQWLARWMRDKHKLNVEIDSRCDDPVDLGEDVRNLVFQSVRELLFNTVKHAQCERAQVVMYREDGRFCVTVEDRGKGFDVQQYRTQHRKPDGFGLFSIEYRMQLIGGEVEFQSAPGQGTRTTLRLPMPAAPAEAVVEVAAPERPAPEAVGAKRAAALRILLADDHKILREGLTSLLNSEPDMHVVAEAADGEQAIELARDKQPDVVIMDITMPRLNGIDATRTILREMPEVKVIGLSLHEEADMAQAMRDAGAVAYLTKGGPAEILINTIRSSVSA